MTAKQKKIIKKAKMKRVVSKWLYRVGVVIVLLCMLLISFQSPTAMFIGTLVVLLAVFILAYSTNRQPSGKVVTQQFKDIQQSNQQRLQNLKPIKKTAKKAKAKSTTK